MRGRHFDDFQMGPFMQYSLLYNSYNSGYKKSRILSPIIFVLFGFYKLKEILKNSINVQQVLSIVV